MTFLFLAPLLLGRSLWSPSCLPFLWPIDFLADFIALLTAFRVNILTIVFTTTLPMPPICLVLPRCECLTRGSSHRAPPVPCFVGSSKLDLLLAQVHLDFDYPLADVKLLLYRAVTRRFPPGLLTLCGAWCRPLYPPLRASRPPRQSAARGRRLCGCGSPLSLLVFSGPRPRPRPPAQTPRRRLSGPPKPRL